MSIRKRMKELVESTPEPLGSVVARVPFSLRLGPQYRRSQRDIALVERIDIEQLRDFVFTRVKRVVQAAAAENAFYRDLFRRNGFEPEHLRSFDDIELVPIVTKDDLQGCPIEQRSSASRGSLRTNTGGTSGKPLEFYLDRAAFAREWAHMHHIWRTVGYRPTDLKLTFRGRNLGDSPLRYNAVHNEFMVNIYADAKQVADAVGDLAKVKEVTYLHGYPSAIYDFVEYVKRHRMDVAKALKRNLKGILFGSEFPAPPYRSTIDEVLEVSSVSWYGHSEMAVLAFEARKAFEYHPVQSYGFCEAVPRSEGGHRLVGTSYGNFDSPFIRYDTGDAVEPVTQRGGILGSFQISEGRTGEFIVDDRGQRVSLTALIFGRHHPAFGRARFIQVRQDAPGKATLLVTANEDALGPDPAEGFDLTNVALKFDFEVRDAPVRTASGKVPLLVRHQP